VQHRGQVFAGLRAEGRDHLPVTSTQLLAAVAPLSLVKQRLRVDDAVVDVLTPTTLRRSRPRSSGGCSCRRPLSTCNRLLLPTPPEGCGK
jgi:hypothetical protein